MCPLPFVIKVFNEPFPYCSIELHCAKSHQTDNIMLAKLKKLGVTLEPNAFLISFGFWLIYGARVDTNLQMWKICLDELDYNETICEDLTNEKYINIMAEVQVWLNNFDMVESWIKGAPGLIYAIFVGSLADDFGRKPLMIFPLVGAIITSTVKIINLIWVRELPTEFFYLTNGLFYNLLGGYSVYLLGSYSFGASVSSESQRATTLARIDGFEILGSVIGCLLSPHLGTFGSFFTCLCCQCLALLYLCIVVDEPIKTKEFKYVSLTNCIHRFLITPVKQTFQTMTEARGGQLNFILMILLIAHGLNWFDAEWYWSLQYNYMLMVFENFTATEYSYYVSAIQALMSTFAILIMPTMKVHESIFCVIAWGLTSLVYFVLPWITNIWMYFGMMTITVMTLGCWAASRTLLSFCVHPNDIGKIYGTVAIITAIIPLISNPIYKQLYNFVSLFTTFSDWIMNNRFLTDNQNFSWFNYCSYCLLWPCQNLYLFGGSFQKI